MTAAYAMLANGGRRITPSFIDRMQNRQGDTIFKHDDRPCPGCVDDRLELNQATPILIPTTASRSPIRSRRYQIVSIMQRRGPARHRPAAAPAWAGRWPARPAPPTTAFDTWFVGFSPDLVAGVYVGFDTPRTLGPRETGVVGRCADLRPVHGARRCTASRCRRSAFRRGSAWSRSTRAPVCASTGGGIYESLPPGHRALGLGRRHRPVRRPDLQHRGLRGGGRGQCADRRRGDARDRRSVLGRARSPARSPARRAAGTRPRGRVPAAPAPPLDGPPGPPSGRRSPPRPGCSRWSPS